ncbi:NAD-dependent epimerase/dehydratase family protein [Actinoplanes sp. NPDC051470]|uniref:NAD-dependent epimerase/dehydratase family protein n=1 Tax=Actinoplanes sp. NPDC051470 TaxID=3157224 RepID=UPI0034160DCF
MRVVVVGASGNAGTALLRRLAREPGVEVVGVSRRVPAAPTVEWHSRDIGDGDLAGVFAGADAVVQLAWQIQPSHDRRQLFRTNVLGTRNVVAAALAAGVRSLIVASSVGAYAPGPKDAYVTEDWPATGIVESSYSTHKALVEKLLDDVEREQSGLRIVRLRPGLIFQRTAGTEIARYFAGPLLPVGLLRAQRIPLLPGHPDLRVQAVHADDVADAYAKALLADVRGPFNVAAAPVLDTRLAARMFRGVRVPVPGVALRAAADLTWRLRLQPVDAGWVVMGLKAPLMSCDRIARELGWAPVHDAGSTLREFIAGFAERAHDDTPPMSGDPELAGRPRGLLRGRLPGTGNPY